MTKRVIKFPKKLSEALDDISKENPNISVSKLVSHAVRAYIYQMRRNKLVSIIKPLNSDVLRTIHVKISEEQFLALDQLSKDNIIPNKSEFVRGLINRELKRIQDTRNITIKINDTIK